ncbi:hypothetical protein [Rhodovulum adriaticum]|uniref:Phasin protein n=1 Tax=Rhodovulum adriaticum TaxID=35804 RepID=A0A4R2NU01_RHOAD|nr:hypothetical protein [Rhodovulum adriaticum]MBK1636895.1 hypothetical protein [Rhodovulum adriaticum]TCP25450.1 hypothetical protein EV656_103202 [Rhodovulum adriaticum]
MSGKETDTAEFDPLRSLAAAQAEGVGLAAWLGCAMVDYTRRAANDMAGFARDKALRDAETLARAMTCRDAASLAAIQQDYLGETVAAATKEAAHQAEKTAQFCSNVRERMTSALDEQGS